VTVTVDLAYLRDRLARARLAGDDGRNVNIYCKGEPAEAVVVGPGRRGVSVLRHRGAGGDVSAAATFSPCRTWRYTLHRDVAPLTGSGRVAFIGLNPSTADETRDDPTIRRCIRFARDWGYAELVMLNAYAYRSTDPAGLWEVGDPVGPDNDEWIARESGAANLVVCAWGVHCDEQREREVLALLPPRPRVLGFTKDGHPRHPLYMRADTTPVKWCPEAA
jgi:hypothetical protein